ncbi:MAG: phosphate ABC transporter ATP-binding protein PstB [Melioribacteraceae bacterium]|nr:phosphate ABC transporter ATP-binding protein PstB [Melioribacteraceae bacterium]MCF8263256.1 phosphate ABC transporter ATP-binding protein PstB [Melioribacteraceae bacterium]MCF8412873.1 phosphate ABC transporter ATP-binding protein PstB [Melioribacteraceae bacterium]MCF8430696.1 phosphate ABC transporter ATP-binding protein PstB [Melioribacteraceae bacterium]
MRTKIKIENLSVFFNYIQALNNVSIQIPENRVTSIIGPSGCGKTSFLRTLNRMNELIHGYRLKGKVIIDDIDINEPDIDVVNLRRLVGMVFQKANLFPKTVYENLAFASKIHGIDDNEDVDDIIEHVCEQAAIWNEIKDRLHENALNLSLGQQQRLCIARALTVEPDILLMDEPASALDPISTAKIEELILELKKKYTIIVVTHNMQQAARISDFTAFLYMGQLVEFDKTTKLFMNPSNKQTEDYITGRFG